MRPRHGTYVYEKRPTYMENTRCTVNLVVGPVCGEAEVQRDWCVEKSSRKEIAVLKRDLEMRLLC